MKVSKKRVKVLNWAICMSKHLKPVKAYLPTTQYCNTLILPFILTTDASNFATGAVLSQGNLGSDKTVCFASRTLPDTWINYSTIEKEPLAIAWATKYFQPYLFGVKFNIITNHQTIPEETKRIPINSIPSF